MENVEWNKLCSNWIINECLALYKRERISVEEFIEKIPAENLAKLLYTIKYLQGLIKGIYLNDK